MTSNEPLAQLYTLFAARSGDSLAQMTMGYKYLYGHGTPKDCHKVFFLLWISIMSFLLDTGS